MPSARRGSGTASSSSNSGANAVTATSTSVAAPRVRVLPIGEAGFPTSAAVLSGPVAPGPDPLAGDRGLNAHRDEPCGPPLRFLTRRRWRRHAGVTYKAHLMQARPI